MGDRVMRTSRPVGPDDVVDEFVREGVPSFDPKAEIMIADIDKDGCVVQIQVANVSQGILGRMDVRRVDTPSGPHLLRIPTGIAAVNNASFRLQCIADPGQTGPFTVRYSFRWLV